MIRGLVRAARLYGDGAAAKKLEALARFERGRLRTARELLELHEALCFLRAYPDSAEVLEQVERMLSVFHRRSDLRRHREALADSGVAGTTIHYRLFWPAARWVCRRWPDRLFLDLEEEEESAILLRRALPLLVSSAEAETLKQDRWSAGECLDRLRGSDETDAAFYVRRVEALPGNDFTREAFHDGIDAAYRIEPGPDTPSRTRAHHRRCPVVYRTRPFERARPSLLQELRRPPRAERWASAVEGRQLIELAREAMVTRSRDLEVFSHGNPHDVRIVDDGDGLQFAVIGMLPERRLLFQAAYGYLSLRNGVPIGYVQSDALFGDAAVSFNTFETYRGTEAAHVFARVLAVTRHLFGATSFSIEPYQLGRGNSEGLASGAWWFYYKLGFRPRGQAVKRLVRRELARMKRNAGYRSDEATLLRLAAEHLYMKTPGGSRRPLPPPPWNVGLEIARDLADRRGADRERALRDCDREAARLLGLGSRAGWSTGERAMWKRWSPIVLALPGVSRWSRADRRALVRVVRAKGGTRESDFLELADGHPCLRPAVRRWLTGPRS